MPVCTEAPPIDITGFRGRFQLAGHNGGGCLIARMLDVGCGIGTRLDAGREESLGVMVSTADSV